MLSRVQVPLEAPLPLKTKRDLDGSCTFILCNACTVLLITHLMVHPTNQSCIYLLPLPWMLNAISEDVAVIQLTSDTLSIEYQKGDGEEATPIAAAAGGAPRIGGASSVEGEQVVRCDISIKGFHFQVNKPRHTLLKIAMRKRTMLWKKPARQMWFKFVYIKHCIQFMNPIAPYE